MIKKSLEDQEEMKLNKTNFDLSHIYIYRVIYLYRVDVYRWIIQY